MLPRRVIIEEVLWLTGQIVEVVHSRGQKSRKTDDGWQTTEDRWQKIEGR
jgi:hypothetical protein